MLTIINVSAFRSSECVHEYIHFHGLFSKYPEISVGPD